MHDDKYDDKNKGEDNISIESGETINSAMDKINNNQLLSTHRSVFVDVTNTTPPMILRSEITTTGHEILREVAR